MSIELDPTKRQDMILKLGLEMIKLGFTNDEIEATLNSLQMIFVTEWLSNQKKGTESDKGGDKLNVVIENARKCPKCGSYDTVGYEGIYGCQDCNHQFPDPLKEDEIDD